MVVMVNMTSINANQLGSRAQSLARPHGTLSLKAEQNLSRTSFSQIFSVQVEKKSSRNVVSLQLYFVLKSLLTIYLCKLEGFPDTIFQ